MKNALAKINLTYKSLIVLVAVLIALAAVLGYTYQKYIQNAYVTGAPRPLIIGALYDNFGNEGDEETDDEADEDKPKAFDDYGDLSLDALQKGD
ncbi:MAG: hypothetical protein LBN36_07095, partial [Clostridiales Family XIII bacterium]|nr:hypothetical protein [Clostridiales Family XIII bacterium]